MGHRLLHRSKLQLQFLKYLECSSPRSYSKLVVTPATKFRRVVSSCYCAVSHIRLLSEPQYHLLKGAMVTFRGKTSSKVCMGFMICDQYNRQWEVPVEGLSILEGKTGKKAQNLEFMFKMKNLSANFVPNFKPLRVFRMSSTITNWTPNFGLKCSRVALVLH